VIDFHPEHFPPVLCRCFLDRGIASWEDLAAMDWRQLVKTPRVGILTMQALRAELVDRGLDFAGGPFPARWGETPGPRLGRAD